MGEGLSSRWAGLGSRPGSNHSSWAGSNPPVRVGACSSAAARPGEADSPNRPPPGAVPLPFQVG